MSRIFHGLSSPEDLIKMWRELKYDDDKRDMNVIWDYTHPEQLKDGFNIVNILYDPENPEETGHYILITVNTFKNPPEVEYFNPVASHTIDDVDKLRDLLKYFKKKRYNIYVNLDGKQTETSENCGFHCLTHAYNYYVDKKNNMNNFKTKVEQKVKVDDDIEDLIENYKSAGATNSSDFEQDLLKVVRGIYYGLKYGFDAKTPIRRKKKDTGAGLADFKPKYFNYTELRHEMED